MPNASRSEPASALLSITSPSESPAAVTGWNSVDRRRAGGPFSTPVGKKSVIPRRPLFPTVSTWLPPSAEKCIGTPIKWLTAQRIGRARELLEASTLPVEDVGEASGLGIPANFRRHFTQATGVTPSTYRRTFNARDTGNRT
jgi:helix-turn-helix protein